MAVAWHPSRAPELHIASLAPQRNADIFPDDYNRAVGVRQIS